MNEQCTICGLSDQKMTCSVSMCNRCYYKQYRASHKDDIRRNQGKWSQSHLEHEKQRHKLYYDTHQETIKLYRKSHLVESRARKNQRVRSNIQFRLGLNLRNRLRLALKNDQKRGSAVRDLGCTIDSLKKYLELKWLPGMSWDNYGKKSDQWSIDHIIPLTRFDLTDVNQLKKACHYTNLQPMWHIDNIKKGNR